MTQRLLLPLPFPLNLAGLGIAACTNALLPADANIFPGNALSYSADVLVVCTGQVSTAQTFVTACESVSFIRTQTESEFAALCLSGA